MQPSARRPWSAFALTPRRRVRLATARTTRPAWWEQSDAPLGAAEDEALRRRARAVLLALRDPSDLVRRLARRLFTARRATVPHGRATPRPPRTLGAPPPPLARKPEPRPPDAHAEPDRAPGFLIT